MLSIFFGSRLSRTLRAGALQPTHRRFNSTIPSLGPLGVAKVVIDSSSTNTPSPTLFTQELSLSNRVALVTGGNRGIGLETALALSEAGARSVYCVDLAKEPGVEWQKVRSFVDQAGLGNFEYISGDVRDQEGIWKIGEDIGDKEGRIDVCVTAAGIALPGRSLEYPAKDFQDVISVNLNGTLFAAQAAGRQMVRFGTGGSIIMIASICGSVALEPTLPSVSYHSSKSAVLQLARSMACELGSKRIRVNTVSPGFIVTRMVDKLVETPELKEFCESANPLGRFGRPDELRGVLVWLASDASSFCTGSDIIVDGGHRAW